MTRGQKQAAAELETKAQTHAIILRQTLQDYNDSVQNSPDIDPKLQMEKERKIERSIAQLAQIHKALRRIRKKMRASK